MQNFIIVIASQGPRQQSLSALLRTIPGIEHIFLVDDCVSALALSRDAVPNLVIIDSRGLEDNANAGLRALKDKVPGLRCLLLSEQPKYETGYRSLGADTVLVDGFTVEQFSLAVTNLLSNINVESDTVL